MVRRQDTVSSAGYSTYHDNDTIHHLLSKIRKRRYISDDAGYCCTIIASGVAAKSESGCIGQ